MKRLLIIIALFISLLLRIFLAVHYYGNYDQISYEIVAKIVRMGGNVYVETNRYNYSPIWLTILGILARIPVPLHISVRMFLNLVDVGISLTIYKISHKPLYAVIYWVNPISILLTGYHGQFDNFAALFLLLAYANRKNIGLIGFLGTLSILIKQTTLFGYIALLFIVLPSKKQFALMVASSSLIFISTFIPYLPEGLDGIINNVFLYKSIVRDYGLNNMIPTPGFFLMMFISISISKYLHFDSLSAIIFSFLAFLFFAPGISTQYFILPIIFASLIPDWHYFIYTVVISFFLLGSLDNIALYFFPAWEICWFAVLYWYFKYLSPLESQKGIIEIELIDIEKK